MTPNFILMPRQNLYVALEHSLKSILEKKCALKDIFNRLKRQSIEWEKYLQIMHLIRD
jgi:hypothetical protein